MSHSRRKNEHYEDASERTEERRSHRRRHEKEDDSEKSHKRDHRKCHDSDHEKDRCHKKDHEKDHEKCHDKERNRCRDRCCKRCNNCCNTSKACRSSCCREFGEAFGAIIGDGAQEVLRQINLALGRGVPLAEITARLPLIQFFTFTINGLVRGALADPGRISDKCCEGYVRGLEGLTAGTILLTIANAVNPLIPAGDINNPAPQPGTVVQNIRTALSDYEANLAALQLIARGCTK